jgi:hypothetical protein
MTRSEAIDARDVLLHERAAGVFEGWQQQDTHDAIAIDVSLALYVVSLHNVNNVEGELLNGDALLVRRRGTSEAKLLAAILGCEPRQVGDQAGSTGSWSIREVAEIDGHRVRFESA